jgi:hypothetical protein
MSIVGQCKVDPATGVAKLIFDALLADADDGLLATAATSNSTERKLLGALLQAITTGLLGAGNIGTATILIGNNSVTVLNDAVTVNSAMFAVIRATGADATLTHITRVSYLIDGQFVIHGNAAATGNIPVAYVVFN